MSLKEENVTVKWDLKNSKRNNNPPWICFYWKAIVDSGLRKFLLMDFCPINVIFCIYLSFLHRSDQQFGLWPQFSDSSRKSHWFSGCLDFSVAVWVTQWQFLSSLHVGPETISVQIFGISNRMYCRNGKIEFYWRVWRNKEISQILDKEMKKRIKKHEMRSEGQSMSPYESSSKKKTPGMERKS